MDRFISAFLLACFVAFPLVLSAQNKFVRFTNGFTTLRNGKIQWIDLDKDNDLDLIHCGERTDVSGDFATYVYENLDGILVVRSNVIGKVRRFESGDYDNDGDLDLVVATETDIKVLRNDGGFVLTAVFTIANRTFRKAYWFDVDRDEDIDLFVSSYPYDSGLPNANATNVIYRNNAGTFTPIAGTGLPNCATCPYDFGDVDGNGTIDIIIGSNGLYRNNGNNTFTLSSQSQFPFLYTDDLRFGDAEGDGDLDLLVTGLISSPPAVAASIIHENQHGKFVIRHDISLPPAWATGNEKVHWFNYNNQGLRDLIISGRPSGSTFSTTYVLRNDGQNVFTPVQESALTNIECLDAADFDNDGDIDLAFNMGFFRNTLLTEFPVANTKPLPPDISTFSEDFFRDEIIFSWGQGSDAQTPAGGLAYNFYLRKGTSKIIVPPANLTNGNLFTTNEPNASQRKGFAKGIGEGQFHYAVQSIDGQRAGSVFSPEKSFFHINGPQFATATVVDGENIALSWLDHSAIETGFTIFRSTSPTSGFASLVVKPANATTHTDHFAFQPEVIYSYRILGNNATMNSAYDSIHVVIPARVTAVEAIAVNDFRIDLSWHDESEYETGFVIEGKKASDASYSTIAEVGPNLEKYSYELAKPGTTYQFRVKSVGPNGGLEPSGLIEVTTNYLPAGNAFSFNGVEDQPLKLSKSQFAQHFTDPDAGDNLVAIKIASLPSFGSLFVVNDPAQVGQLVPFEVIELMTFRPLLNFADVAEFSVYAFDGKSYSSEPWTIKLQFTQVNDPPVFTLPTVREVNEDFPGVVTLQPQLQFDGWEQNSVTFSMTSQTTPEVVNASIDPTTGKVSLSAIADANGEQELTITADDGQPSNNLYSRKVTVVVKPVQDVATFGQIASVEVEIAEPVPPILLNFTNRDRNTAPFMFFAESSAEDILQSQNITFTVNNDGAVVMHLRPERKLGTATVNVVTTYPSSPSKQTFKLIVFTTTGITDDSSNDVLAYPNPVDDELYVVTTASAGNPVDIYLHNTLGQQVYHERTTSGETLIGTTGLIPGVYIVSAASNQGVSRQKITRK